MDEELCQHFKFVEQSFFSVMPSFLRSFSSSAEIKDLAKLRDQTAALQKYRPHTSSFELRVTLLSKKFSKGLEFSYCEGPHISGNRYHSTALKIYRVDEDNIIISGLHNKFYFRDYFSHKNIEIPIPFLFFEDEYALAQPKICKAINQFVMFLNIDEIRRVLTSQEWIVVPPEIQRV